MATPSGKGGHEASPNSETSVRVSDGSLNDSETTASRAQEGDNLAHPDASSMTIIVSK